MSSTKRKTALILKDVQETLKTAELGLAMLIKGPPELKLCGLRNLAVFGRATTFVLQNLRSTESEFDLWYARHREEMESDPLLIHFKNLRNELEKEGSLYVSARVNIKEFSFPQDLSRFGPPPPNAKSFFIGDRVGGTGWEVRLPDGSTAKYYVNLPQEIGTVSLHFPKSPKTHLGKRLLNDSIEALCTLYISYLQKLVREAKEKFEMK